MSNIVVLNSVFMSTDKERMELLLAHLKMNANELATSLGHKRPDRVYHVIRGRNGISASLAREIIFVYPDISFYWLKNGDGNMIDPEANNTYGKRSLAAMERESQKFKDRVIEKLLQERKENRPRLDEVAMHSILTPMKDEEIISAMADPTDEQSAMAMEKMYEMVKFKDKTIRRLEAKVDSLEKELDFWKTKANKLEYEISKNKLAQETLEEEKAV